MKRLWVYWRNSPQDLDVLQVLDHIRLGPDGEEVITTDEGAAVIRAMSKEFARDFWIEGVEDIEPWAAAEEVLRSVPREEAPALLRSLISMVGKEDEEAATALLNDLEDLLRAG